MPRAKSPALNTIMKRNGSSVPFDADKIAVAVGKAMKAAGEFREQAPEKVAEAVEKKLIAKKTADKTFTPTVEGVQDEVETELMLQEFPATAKAYILYRAERTRMRQRQGDVPEHVRALVQESKKYFKDNPLGEFVYLRTYARWIDAESRRETWIETVDRYMTFMQENLGDKLRGEEYAELRVDRAQAPALPAEDLFPRKLQQGAQRLRPGSFASHGFEPGARGADERKIKFDVLSGVPGAQSQRQGVAPAFFGIFDDVRGQFLF